MTKPTQDKIEWPEPTSEMLASPQFEAIWQCIKQWDINVPDAYQGYCRATGNHVRAILDAAAQVEEPTDYFNEQKHWIEKIKAATIERCAQVAYEFLLTEKQHVFAVAVRAAIRKLMNEQ